MWLLWQGVNKLQKCRTFRIIGIYIIIHQTFILCVMYIVILEETIDDCSSVFLITNIIPSLVLDAGNKTILELILNAAY